MVLGVDFGTVERAALVQKLVDACSTQAGGSNLDDKQGKVDGFNDAWDACPVNLSRFDGSNMRTAVEYAKAYFEGYDRLQKDATPSPATKPVVNMTKPAVVKKPSPGLVGYNKGRSDGANRRAYNNGSSFSGADADTYETAYYKGYYSVY
jgi:hypothetical protein